MKTTLRKLTTAWPLAIFLLLPALTRAETAIQAWVQRYNAPGNYNIARAEAVDGSNNVIVTGYSTGSGGNWDYATIKYSSAGVPLWTNRYNGPGNGTNEASAVAVDHSGNVIVAGGHKQAAQLMRFMQRYVRAVTQCKYRFNRWSMSCMCDADFWLERFPQLLDLSVIPAGH
jgi:hypothetical protein